MEPASSMSLFDTLSRGGWTMLPLFLCSVVALAIIVERILAGPRRSRIIPDSLLAKLSELVRSGKLDEAVGCCDAHPAPFAAVAAVALRSHGRDREEIVSLLEAEGKVQAAKLTKYLPALGTIAAVSPLLGLLGTVFGMIRTFHVVATGGLGNAAALSGGIAEALISTATGLTIAIPTVVAYRYFLQQANSLVVEMEVTSLRFVESIDEAKSRMKAA